MVRLPQRKSTNRVYGRRMATTMLDLDGVIYPWVDTFQPWLEAKLDRPLQPWVTWHHYRFDGITDEQFVELLHQFADEGGFHESDPFEGVANALLELEAAGHTVHVVTDRPNQTADGTVEWLKRHGIYFTSITISRDKTIFKDFGPGPYFAIDDRIENVQAMRDAGIDAYLLTWPWNEESDLPRVSTVAEYVDLVLQYTVGRKLIPA